MTKRQINILVTLNIGVVLTFCALSLMIIGDFGTRQASVPTGTRIPRPTARPTATPTPVILEFKGGGDKVLTFSSSPGLAFFGFAYKGDGNFIVKLIDSVGHYDLLVNTIGDYQGERSSVMRKGNYVLEITADGNWAAVVMLPN